MRTWPLISVTPKQYLEEHIKQLLWGFRVQILQRKNWHPLNPLKHKHQILLVSIHLLCITVIVGWAWGGGDGVFLKTISRWFQCCPSTHLAFGNQFTSRLSLIKSNGDSEAIFPNLTRHQLWCMRTPPSSDIGSIWDPPQSSATKTLCLILLQVLRISVVKNNTDRGTECLRLDPQKLCKREAICSGNVKGSFQILALFRFLPPRASWQIKHCFWEGRAQRVCSQLQRGRKHPERHVGCAGLEESSHPFQTREHPNSLQLLYSGSHLLWRQNIIWVISFIVHNSSSGFSCKLWRHSSKLFRSSELLSLKIIQSSGFHLPPVGLPSSLGGQQTFSAEARE